MKIILALLIAFTAAAQIPGTFRVTGPVAPPATNSNFGAALPVYNYGGLLTGLSSLSQLQDTNRYPVARRHAGQIAVLTSGAVYQLDSTLTNWASATWVTSFENVDALVAANPSNATTSTFYVKSRSTLGDGGDGFVYWSGSSTQATNTGFIFAYPYGSASGRYIRQTSGSLDVRWFGATPYYWFAHPFYGQNATNVVSPGTGDFSVAVSFKAMGAYDLYGNGIFRLTDLFSTARNIEVYGAGAGLEILLRGTNGTSSTSGAGNAAKIVFSSTPLTLGASNNLAITRTAGTWLVYVNGIDVTATATIQNSGELSGDVTLSASYPPSVGLTSAGQLHREPIYWLRGWNRVLTPAESATNQNLTDYVWAVSSQLQSDPVDSSAQINNAVAAAFVNNIGEVHIPSGKYRMDTPLYMRPAVTVRGDGYAEWWSGNNAKSAPSVLWSWDSSETNHGVVFWDQYMTNQPRLLASGVGFYGQASNLVAQSFVKDLAISTAYSRFGTPVRMFQVANAGVENVQLQGAYGYLIDAWAGNDLQFNGVVKEGFVFRQQGMRLLSVSDSRMFDTDFGGAYGPGLLLQGNKNLIANNYIFNSSDLSTGLSSPTADTGTDAFTATNHGYFTGQSLFVEPASGALPAPLATNTCYFALKIDENTFRLSTIYTSNSVTAGALFGGYLDVTTTGTAGWTIQPGEVANIQIFAGDGNTITGNRADQSYKYNLAIVGSGRNVITGNGLQEAGYNNSTTTNIGGVLLSGNTAQNLVAHNFLGKARVSSLARYGIELRGAVSNIVAPNIYQDVTETISSDSTTGKIQGPWQNLRGDAVLGSYAVASQNDTGGFLWIPSLNAKMFTTPAGLGTYPWGSALVMSTNTGQNTLMVLAGNGTWRSIPTFERDTANVTLGVDIFGLRYRSQPRNIALEMYSATATDSPGLQYIRGGETDTFYSSKAPVVNGDTIFAHQGVIYYATNSIGGTVVEIVAKVTETPSVSAQGTELNFLTTPTGSVTRRTGVSVKASGTADDTDLLLWDVTAGTLKRVTRGAADSGGVGFRVLRVAN